jgi:hypothetical protein
LTVISNANLIAVSIIPDAGATRRRGCADGAARDRANGCARKRPASPPGRGAANDGACRAADQCAAADTLLRGVASGEGKCSRKRGRQQKWLHERSSRDAPERMTKNGQR